MADVFPWLLLEDNCLLKKVDLKNIKASKKGGQKVNKTSAAVRLKLEDLGVEVSCQKYRSLEANKKSAVRLLRKKIALENDCETPLEVKKMLECYFLNGLNINRKNKAYALFLASIVEKFITFEGEHKKVARDCCCSISSLIKFIYTDKLLLEKIGAIRKHYGKTTLKK